MLQDAVCVKYLSSFFLMIFRTLEFLTHLFLDSNITVQVNGSCLGRVSTFLCFEAGTSAEFHNDHEARTSLRAQFFCKVGFLVRYTFLMVYITNS